MNARGPPPVQAPCDGDPAGLTRHRIAGRGEHVWLTGGTHSSNTSTSVNPSPARSAPTAFSTMPAASRSTATRSIVPDRFEKYDRHAAHGVQRVRTEWPASGHHAPLNARTSIRPVMSGTSLEPESHRQAVTAHMEPPHQENTVGGFLDRMHGEENPEGPLEKPDAACDDAACISQPGTRRSAD